MPQPELKKNSPSNKYQFEQKNKYKSMVDQKKKEEQDKILLYKQRAHQSFMQVIQMQQLHQQQINQLRSDYEDRIAQLEQQISSKNQMLSILQKSSKHHLLELQQSLLIDSVQPIQCKQEVNQTKFDDESILNLRQILIERQGQNSIQILKIDFQSFIAKEINSHRQISASIKQQLSRKLHNIFDFVRQIRLDLQAKSETHQNLLRKFEETQFNYQKLKKVFEAMQKQSSFLGNHLSSLTTSKLSLEKKVVDLQRQLKQYKGDEFKGKESLLVNPRSLKSVNSLKILKMTESASEYRESVNGEEMCKEINKGMLRSAVETDIKKNRLFLSMPLKKQGKK